MKGSWVFLLLLWCGLTQAQVVLDQEQADFNEFDGTLAIGSVSEQILAQTFTVGRSGDLVELQVPIVCQSGELILEIRPLRPHGTPAAEVIRRQIFPGSDFPDIRPRQFRPLTLSASLPVTRGDTFAIVLRNDAGRCAVPASPGDDDYSRGFGYYEARPNPPGLIRFLPAGKDAFPFRTYVRLPGSSSSSDCDLPATPGGGPPPPINRYAPICNCLRDAAAREFRCALLHPDFFAFRRIPWPLQAGEPFEVEWTVLPLTAMRELPILVETWASGTRDSSNGLIQFSGPVKIGSPVSYRYKALAGNDEQRLQLKEIRTFPLEQKGAAATPEQNVE